MGESRFNGVLFGPRDYLCPKLDRDWVQGPVSFLALSLKRPTATNEFLRRRPRILPLFKPHWPGSNGFSSFAGPYIFFLLILISFLNLSFVAHCGQAQLTATLFPAKNTRPTSHQPCNTPLARTPSNSISMGSMSIDMTIAMRTSANSRRESYSTPHHVHSHSKSDSAMSPTAFHHHHHQYHHTSPFDDTMMEEDERMVEELLLPPPSSASPTTPASPSFFEGTAAAATSPLSASASLFTTSDPFYLSQLQASQQPFAPNPTAAQSVFAQNGRMTQGSRFALQAAF